MTRQEKTAYLIARDIYYIQSGLDVKDWSFLFDVLEGSNFKAYSLIDDVGIDELFKDFLRRWDEEKVGEALESYLQRQTTINPHECVEVIIEDWNEADNNQ